VTDTNALDSAVAKALAAACGTSATIRARRPLSGGSICRTERIDTTEGPFVLKSLAAGGPGGLFEAEAQGLSALRASHTSLTIPRVVAVATSPVPFLVLEYIDSAPRGADFDERLGRGLAELHASPASEFGFDHDNFCGATPQRNTRHSRWIDFYRSERLGAQIELAAGRHLLSASDHAALDALLAHLDRWLEEPRSGPALIHGDLWSGNLIVDSAGRPGLIDPAVSYSHPEAELGMMTLFGGFSERTIDAYAEASGLDRDWRDRNPLYQLYHVLNHLNLFGHAYLDHAMSIVRRYEGP
jgi:protein-ribulosamine 3-kinase